MTNLNDLNVVNREYSLESGFFWVEFENGKSLQCCLVSLGNDGCYTEYAPQVDINNNGFDDGLSWDNNQWAADEDGETWHIEEFLINQARQCGLQIVV